MATPLHFDSFIPGPVQKINGRSGYPQLYIKRLDLIQSWATGNKYYKLKNTISYILEQGIKTIVSKGGMFSNHLYSLAHACANFNLELISVVRSYSQDEDNPTITELKSLSREILFVQPEVYDLFDEHVSALQFPGAYFIPEGGMSENGIRGVEDLMRECQAEMPTHIIISGGSMTTACGLIAAAPESVKIIIVPAWKGCSNQYVEDILTENKINSLCSWEIWPDAHRGGFGKFDSGLIEFMYSFTEKYNVPLDPVYTGKMMYAIEDKIISGYFNEDDSILAIHSGGLQGVRGFAYRFPEEWGEYAKLVLGNIE